MSRLFPFYGGMRQGRTAATLARVAAEAATEEDAQLCGEDLREYGYCLMQDGKRVRPRQPSPPKVVFDEEPVRPRRR